MLFSVLFVRIITKSTKAVLFGFSSDEDDEEMGFVTRDVLGMGACNKMPTARMHITILETKAELFDVFRKHLGIEGRDKHDSLEPI